MGIFNNGDVLICVLYEIVSQGMTGCLYTRKVSSYIFCARKKERKDTKKGRQKGITAHRWWQDFLEKFKQVCTGYSCWSSCSRLCQFSPIPTCLCESWGSPNRNFRKCHIDKVLRAPCVIEKGSKRQTQLTPQI